MKELPVNDCAINKEKNIEDTILYVKLKLFAMGHNVSFSENMQNAMTERGLKFLDLSKNLVQDFREKARLLSDHLPPVDQRIQDFIENYLGDVQGAPKCRLPNNTFILDQEGLAREVSLPLGGDKFENDYINSYRIKQGILNNPLHDRRTTKGSFHIVAGGLPTPADKIETPKIAFANLLNKALQPDDGLMTFPFTATAKNPARLFVSLYLRPIVCPEVEGINPEKTMETRFFAPGSLVSNLDFVETIFGNAGHPDLCENDAALDIDHWTGHTGCIILAPHLMGITKRKLGLPARKYATDRQKRDGMCWECEDEQYNDGHPFKLTCRNEEGVVVTIISDNYYGYSKKEIKTQIGYSANLYGLCEEEHAGGSLVFARRSIQDTFFGDLFIKKFAKPYSFEQVKKKYGDLMRIQKDNYGIDKIHPNIVYIPENSTMKVYEGAIKWTYKGMEKEIKISPDKVYVYPTGHKLQMEQHPASDTWRIISTVPEPIVCHKPCTVSGGGKSEISKSLENAINYGPFYVQNIHEDFEYVDNIINYNFQDRWKDRKQRTGFSRTLLSPKRALGSVVKLLTPSELYTDDYNEFLEEIPPQVKNLVFFVKMFYRSDRHTNWKDYVSVNKLNGREGHTLYFNRRRVVSSFIRLGFQDDHSWCMNTLRTDFVPSFKIQLEDDITASVTLPANRLNNLNPEFKNKSVKFVRNCEKSFFQRPDDAIVRGYDKKSEADLSSTNTFITNYEPLTKADAIDLMDMAIDFHSYTQPVKDLISEVIEDNVSYFIAPSHPRLVNGVPTKNPRYLQKGVSVDINTFDKHLAEVGTRLSRKIPLDRPVYYPVNAVLPSRRNNPIDVEAGIRPLSVYSPIHFQELPELFMEFVCSLTGKSPSTTGAGSEGALTKGPFNMLLPTHDINNALLSFILTETQGFSSAAGYIGSKKFEHDISVLIPEIWARFEPEARDAKKMIEEGSLEKIEDFEYNGEKVLGSRLGYRITKAFCFRNMNRLFAEPQLVFTEDILRPELQGMEAFVDGINNIVETQKKVALNYFEDGSVDRAIPPLKAILNIMVYGEYEGKDISDPELRKQFDRDEVIKSDWYQERLNYKQKRDAYVLEKQISYLKEFMSKKINKDPSEKLNLAARLEKAHEDLKYVKSEKYLEDMIGTIGADELGCMITSC